MSFFLSRQILSAIASQMHRKALGENFMHPICCRVRTYSVMSGPDKFGESPESIV
ncbi:MAG: hypothetical protein WA947_12000 [Phormidesmis sp.]